MNQQTFIKIACKTVGGGGVLASKIGVSASAITQWQLDEGDRFFRKVPAERCPQIEHATGGLVRCEDLRPDVQWSVLRNTQPVTQEA